MFFLYFCSNYIRGFFKEKLEINLSDLHMLNIIRASQDNQTFDQDFHSSISKFTCLTLSFYNDYLMPAPIAQMVERPLWER